VQPVRAKARAATIRAARLGVFQGFSFWETAIAASSVSVVSGCSLFALGIFEKKLWANLDKLS